MEQGCKGEMKIVLPFYAVGHTMTSTVTSFPKLIQPQKQLQFLKLLHSGIKMWLQRKKEGSSGIQKKAYIYLVTVSEHAGRAHSGVNTKQKHRYNKSVRSRRRQ